MAINNNHNKNEEETNPNVFSNDYNLTGIPFQNFVNSNDLNFIKGNVVRDINRAIILKPIRREKVVEVMVEEVKENVICVPQVQIIDKYVEVVKPIIRYKIKEVKRPVTVERIKRVPKIVEEEKILEVPEIKYVEKFVEVPKIVQKERIVEVPLPIVRERRIPVLNISRQERFQEVEGLEYKTFNTNSDINRESSIDIHSSLSSMPTKYEETKKNQPETTFKEETQNNIETSGENKGDSRSQEYSDLKYFNSKMVNYNSSEIEELMMDQLSEISINALEKSRNPNEYSVENEIQIKYGLKDPDEEIEYTERGNLSAIEGLCDYERTMNTENNLERCEEISQGEVCESYDFEKEEKELRRSRFESKIIISPRLQTQLSKKLIENISTHVIPKTLRVVEKRKKIKDKNPERK